ncbi:MAG: T9SS C-terminal target domain-containing protein [Sphingobacteriales bacterium]|nr:MAG: T9SS C-terminal target domain-containing protein [Sphingobacteriales bacterium]
MKNFPKIIYSIFISAILIMNINSISAQIINSESFDAATFPPTGWTLDTPVAVGGNPGDIWVRRTNATFPPISAPHSGAGMARFSCHNYSGLSTQDMFTPVIDYSGITITDTATLSFWIYRDTGLVNSIDSLTLLVNTSASLTGSTRLGAIARLASINIPDAVSINGWYFYSFNVPQSFNTTSNYLIFSGTGHSGNHIFIDDVQWTSYPPQCAGTPTIGTLNANPTLICGGSGTTTLTLIGQTSGASGISIVWQSSSSASGPWTDVANDVATYTSVSLTSTTYFRCYISCSNSASADTSAVITIDVSTSPLPVLTVAPNGGAAFCNGGNPVILSVSGAATYSWSPSTGLDNSTNDLVFASPATNTTYTVTGSDSSGCAASATLNITVAIGPNINPTSSTDTTCTGGTVTLNAGGGGGGGGGNTYTWSPGAATGNNVQVNPTSTTTYTLTATSNFSGCSTIDSSIIIVVTQDVAANFDYSMNGNTVLFHDSSFNASTWSWNFGDGNGSTNQNPIYTFSGTGVYTVTLIVTSPGCPGGDTIQIQVSVFPSSINNISNGNQLLVYPNPITDNLLHLNFKMINENAELNIMNSLGQIVMTKIFSSSINKQMNEIINLKDFASGIYEISLKEGGSNSSVRFVKY